MTQILSHSLRAAASALALLLASAGAGADALHASFERMLTAAAPSSSSGPVVRTPGVEADPLWAAMVLPLRDGLQPGAAPQTDPVMASFTRMFTHEPNRTAPQRPDATDADPLIAAIVRPLHSSSHVVAGSHTGPTLTAAATGRRPAAN